MEKRPLAPVLMVSSALRFVVFLILATSSAWPAPSEALGEDGGSGPRLGATARRRAVKELQHDLRSPYGDKRRRTIAKLAKIGGREAFALVLEALSDKGAEAADEAQLVLPGFEASMGTRAVQAALLSRAGLRSKRGLARLRAAEALGRLTGPVDPSKWWKGLDPRNVEVARAVVWSLERQAAAGRLPGEGASYVAGLQRFLQKRTPDRLRASAIHCVAVLDPLGFEAHRARWGKIPGPESRCSVLAARVRVGAHGGDSDLARRSVREALAHKDDVVRAMAVRLVPAMGPEREDLAALAARLGPEQRVALRGRVVRTLQGLTGLKHRGHAAAWAHAVSSLPVDWVSLAPARIGGGSGANSPRGAEAGSAASLERLGPESDRVALLVDFSGSLWNEREDGSCRKDLLDPEMDRLLDRIERDSQFLLIPFTGTPHPYSKASVRATPKELKAAKRFFRKATMRGQGNLYGAVQVALQDPLVDRVLVLTDGAPTGGERWNAKLMAQLIEEGTRFRPVIFDFILFDAPGPLRRTWSELADQTGGRTLCLQM